MGSDAMLLFYAMFWWLSVMIGSPQGCPRIRYPRIMFTHTLDQLLSLITEHPQLEILHHEAMSLPDIKGVNPAVNLTGERNKTQPLFSAGVTEDVLTSAGLCVVDFDWGHICLLTWLASAEYVCARTPSPTWAHWASSSHLMDRCRSAWISIHDRCTAVHACSRPCWCFCLELVM